MCENRVMNHVFQGVVCAINNLTKVLIIIKVILNTGSLLFVQFHFKNSYCLKLAGFKYFINHLVLTILLYNFGNILGGIFALKNIH